MRTSPVLNVRGWVVAAFFLKRVLTIVEVWRQQEFSA